MLRLEGLDAVRVRGLKAFRVQGFQGSRAYLLKCGRL